MDDNKTYFLDRNGLYYLDDKCETIKVEWVDLPKDNFPSVTGCKLFWHAEVVDE